MQGISSRKCNEKQGKAREGKRKQANEKLALFTGRVAGLQVALTT
jgi:hypothetical protein